MRVSAREKERRGPSGGQHGGGWELFPEKKKDRMLLSQNFKQNEFKTSVREGLKWNNIFKGTVTTSTMGMLGGPGV